MGFIPLLFGDRIIVVYYEHEQLPLIKCRYGSDRPSFDPYALRSFSRSRGFGRF
jgi:hypothetical protein